MSQNKRLIIGNWKMNLATVEASDYFRTLDQRISHYDDVTVVVAPTMLALQAISDTRTDTAIQLAAQNLYWRDFGAFTGEVSAMQLRGVVNYAIIGHSERRHVFGESNQDIREKVAAALRNGITPVLCVGETKSERVRGETNAVLHDQLTAGLANITSDTVGQVVIAYEPVWAIGTGDNAEPGDVAATVGIVRAQVARLFGDQAAASQRVLYGGSVTAATAQDYIALDTLQGLLIGGASLKADEFAAIIDMAHNKA